MGVFRSLSSLLGIDAEKASGMVMLGACGVFVGFLVSGVSVKFAASLAKYFNADPAIVSTFLVYILTCGFCGAVGAGLAYFVQPTPVDPKMLPLDAIGRDEERTGM